MTSKAPAAAGFKGSLYEPVRGVVGDWKARSEPYMAWRAKRGEGKPAPWFRRNFPSVLDRLNSTATWTTAFGGISVTLKRTTSIGPRDPLARGFGTRLKGLTKGNARVGVATIRVEAMRRITTSMLPALGGAPLGSFGSNPQASGLLSLLGDDIANRLGGNPNTVPFRPTIQPFLGFFLTRQLPNAVFKRIQQGVGGRLHDGTGSGGRTVGKAGTERLRAAGVIPKF
jgi:hypothetical protein